MQAPTVQLQPGSTNTAAVKQLQDYLVSLGLLDKAAISSGFWGGTPTQNNSTYNPYSRGLLSQIIADRAMNRGLYAVNGTQVTTPGTSGGTPSTTGGAPAGSTADVTNIPSGAYYFGGNNYLTPQEFGALEKSYYDKQTPYYDALQNYELGGFTNTENNILSNYDLSRRDYEARAQEDLDTLNDTEGKNGTWASSERLKRRTNLQDKYNRSFESLYNTNVDNLYKTRLDRAYNYGDSMVGKNTGLSRMGVNFGDTNSTTNVLGTGGTYNPFGFQGRRNVERKSNANLSALNQLETFIYLYKYLQ